MEKRPLFHEQLKQERQRRGWSQEELASKIGSDPKSVRRWESGKGLPRPYYQQKLFEIFKKDAETFGLFEDSRESEPLLTRLREDWGEAPDVTHFYGRQQESAQLMQWIGEKHCRVVTVLGMGGVGKTTLATKVAQQMKDTFTYIFWRSLQHVPPLDHILKQCILFISDQQTTDMPKELDEQVSLLIRYMRDRRCLLILDNIESILQPGLHVGQYASGYESYGRLIQRMGTTQHQSCLLLTSREKPKEVVPSEGKTAPVRSLLLSGVGRNEGRELLQDKGLIGSDEQWAVLVQLYSGNPLALQLVSEPIQEVFGGDIARFLQEEKSAFGDINLLLEQQFHRLSVEEKGILYWLAIEREAASLVDIRGNLVQPVLKEEVLLEALDSLRRRSMIEVRGSALFTLQPVIMEYVTSHLVKRAYQEFGTETVDIWMNYALIKAQAKDYLRNIQRRLILSPLAEQLLSAFGHAGLEQRLKTMLVAQRTLYPHLPSYTAGNALNLLTYLARNLRGADFSHLVVRQAYLQNASLPEVNFSNTHFIESSFTDTFGNILSLTFNPSSDRLVVGTAEGDIWVYHVLTGTPLLTCHGHTDGVWSLAFHPHGDILASSSDDCTIRLWDISTGQCLKTLKEHTSRVRAVTFSPDGHLLASGSDDQTIRLWDAHTASCLKSLQGHTNRVWSVSFSPDGQLLASGSTDHTVRLWDVNTGQCLKILQGHTNWVRSVVFSPDGQLLASGSDDQTIRLWNVHSGQSIKTFQGHSNRVWSVSFSPNGQLLASSSEDQHIRLWDVGTGRGLLKLEGHTHGVRSIAFSAREPQLASGGDDQAIRLWDITTGYCLKTLQGYTNRIWSVSFSPDGHTLVSSSEDQSIRLWNVNSGLCFRSIQDRMHGVRSVTFSPNGQTFASGGEDQTVRLWNINSGLSLKTLTGHTNWVRAIVFNQDGQLLASGSEDQSIRLWDVKTAQCLVTLQGHTSWIRSLAFSYDGSLLASGSDDQTVRLWETATGRCLQILQAHTSRVRAIAFHPNGHLLASGSEDQTILLWEVSTGKPLTTLRGHTYWIRSVAFSPHGHLLASSSDDQTIRLWDVNTGHCLKTLHGHTNRVRWVNFSPNGDLLVSGSDDGTIKLWGTQTLTCLNTLISERPYERMNITNTRGLTQAQKATLRVLGAIEA